MVPEWAVSTTARRGWKRRQVHATEAEPGGVLCHICPLERATSVSRTVAPDPLPDPVVGVMRIAHLRSRPAASRIGIAAGKGARRPSAKRGGDTAGTGPDSCIGAQGGTGKVDSRRCYPKSLDIGCLATTPACTPGVNAPD